MPIRLQLTGLWLHADFRRFWMAQTLSVFSSVATELTLPLMAVLTLQVTPSEMGWLRATQFAPFLLIGLFVGVWVDRLPRRLILIGSDLGRGLLLGSIPLALVRDVLCLEYLYFVSFFVGSLNVFFDVAYQSFLPSLVQHNFLLEGNTKLKVSESSAEIIGTGFAGTIIQIITAPIALMINAICFFGSALLCSRLPSLNIVSNQVKTSSHISTEIIEGLRVVLENPFLRPITGCNSITNFFKSMILSLYVLYLTRNLNIQPLVLGMILAVGACGAFVGAFLTNPLTHWLGLGPTIVGSRLISGIGALLIPLASGPLVITVPLLAVAEFLMSLTAVVFDINQVSLRQTIVPERLQGRMNATIRFLAWGMIPFGSILGGILGEAIGLRSALLVGALGRFIAFLWVFFSPVRTLHKLPPPNDELSRIGI